MNPALRFINDSPLIPVRLFFDQTRDEHFFVLAEVMFRNGHGCVGELSVLTFSHEDEFLERVGAADLPLASVSLLAASVIRSVSCNQKSHGWVELNCTEDQIQSLGLDYPSQQRPARGDIHEVF